jgi:hypothetical protein
MLAPLTHLQHVTLLVVARLGAPDATRARADPPVAIGQGWTGECGTCSAQILARDAPFRAEWAEKKAHAPRPPALARVEWRFDVVSVKAEPGWDEDVIDNEPEDGEEDAGDDVDVDAESDGNDNPEAQDPAHA